MCGVDNSGVCHYPNGCCYCVQCAVRAPLCVKPPATTAHASHVINWYFLRLSKGFCFVYSFQIVLMWQVRDFILNKQLTWFVSNLSGLVLSQCGCSERNCLFGRKKIKFAFCPPPLFIFLFADQMNHVNGAMEQLTSYQLSIIGFLLRCCMAARIAIVIISSVAGYCWAYYLTLDV